MKCSSLVCNKKTYKVQEENPHNDCMREINCSMIQKWALADMPEDTSKTHRVGSRKSELALIQTRFVISELEKLCPGHTFTIVEVWLDPVVTVSIAIIIILMPKQSSRNSDWGRYLLHNQNHLAQQKQWLLSSSDDNQSFGFCIDHLHHHFHSSPS